MGNFMASLTNKTPKEATTDLLLLLYIVDRVSSVGKVEGQKKLLKLIFFSEHSMLLNRMKGLNYEFYKYSHGPFSKEVYQDRDILIENNILSDISGFIVEERGKEILEMCQPVFKENKEFIKNIDSIIKKYAKFPPWKLEKMAYDVEINGIKIKDLPQYYTILTKLSERQSNMVFDIEEEYIETIEVVLNVENFDSLLESLEASQKSSRLYSHEEVFQRV